MAEGRIGDRVTFPRKGLQRKVLLAAKEKRGTSWIELARLLEVQPRTLADWAREKYCMSHAAWKTIVQVIGVRVPISAQVLSWDRHLRGIAQSGEKAVYRRYGCVGGDPETRVRRWWSWWHQTGKHRAHPILHVRLPFKRPKRSESLAEFVGIMLGDGGMSARQLTVTLNHHDDRQYKNYVVDLLEGLFGVVPSVYHDPADSVYSVVISRTDLIDYCTSELGLVRGSKVRQQVDIPQWVKTNSSYRVACLRGLVDTDGSVFQHTYLVNGRRYWYKKLCFTSHSRPLARSVSDMMRSIGLHPRFSRGKDVRLDRRDDIERYFQLVGSHNPKHIRRYSS